jgi:PleD family two-component response regulator
MLVSKKANQTEPQPCTLEVISMAHIMILKERTTNMDALRNSLQPHHKLFFAADIATAMQVLQCQEIDLIVSAVHTENANVFEFIRSIRSDSYLFAIPLICFCGDETEMAAYLDRTLARAALLCGADKYVCVDQFGGASRCNLENLRTAVEGLLDHCADEHTRFAQDYP